MRRVLLFMAVAVLVAALGGCGRRGAGGGGEARQPVPTTTAAAASGQGQGRGPLGVVPMPLAAGPAHVELTALNRTSDTTVTGQFKIVNDGAGDLELEQALYDKGRPERDILNDRYPVSGIGLLDGTG